MKRKLCLTKKKKSTAIKQPDSNRTLKINLSAQENTLKWKTFYFYAGFLRRNSTNKIIDCARSSQHINETFRSLWKRNIFILCELWNVECFGKFNKIIKLRLWFLQIISDKDFFIEKFFFAIYYFFFTKEKLRYCQSFITHIYRSFMLMV